MSAIATPLATAIFVAGAALAGKARLEQRA